MDGNASSSDSEDERAEHSRDIQGGHVLVVRKDTAGRGEIHLTMRNSRFPASHAGGAMNHAAGSADRGEHRDIAAAREFREEYGHELSSMPNRKLADGVFVAYAGPEFAVDPNATHAYEIERRHGRAVEKWYDLERLCDVATLRPHGFASKHNMTKANVIQDPLARFTKRVLRQSGIELLRFAASPPTRPEDWDLRPADDVQLMDVTPSLPAYLAVDTKVYVDVRSPLFDPVACAGHARARVTFAARVVGLWAPRGTKKSLDALEAVLETLRSAGAYKVRELAKLHLTIRGDGYDVADFLAAIKKWQLVVVKKDPGRGLAALRSLVIDKRYNLK